MAIQSLTKEQFKAAKKQACALLSGKPTRCEIVMIKKFATALMPMIGTELMNGRWYITPLVTDLPVVTVDYSSMSAVLDAMFDVYDAQYGKLSIGGRVLSHESLSRISYELEVKIKDIKRQIEFIMEKSENITNKDGSLMTMAEEFQNLAVKRNTWLNNIKDENVQAYMSLVKNYQEEKEIVA